MQCIVQESDVQKEDVSSGGSCGSKRRPVRRTHPPSQLYLHYRHGKAAARRIHGLRWDSSRPHEVAQEVRDDYKLHEAPTASCPGLVQLRFCCRGLLGGRYSELACLPCQSDQLKSRLSFYQSPWRVSIPLRRRSELTCRNGQRYWFHLA